MKVIVCDNYESQCAAGADIIEKIVREKPDCCLGLATGSSPVGMYKELSAAAGKRDWTSARSAP